MTLTDERIDQICSGAPMSTEEREFLLEDTPRFEECWHTKDELAGMSDSDLMRAAHQCWWDYARGQM